MDITQEKVDALVAQAKADWAQAVADSGQSERVFITTRKAAKILGKYAQGQEIAKEWGLSMPDLVEGVKVNLIDE